ncbi:MAG: leucyl aminopeptidase [Thermodesulfatator sp.]|nr:MAG: leucyl aminopeptidase [Thermodesulfatator sp.]
MAHSEFAVKKGYKLEADDLLLFCYLEEGQPVFSKEQIPGFLSEIKCPDEKGKSVTAAAGLYRNKRFVARAARIDDENIPIQEVLKRTISSAISSAEEEGLKRVCLFLSRENRSLVKACQEAAVLGGYKFDKYLEKKAEPAPVVCFLDSDLDTREKKAIKERAEVLGWVNFARDILNEPPNEIHPQALAGIFRSRGKKAGLKVTVWDEKRLQKEKCGGVLAVGKGASSRPCLVIGEYKPRKPKGFLCLVGKGVTMDTGGYCLKPANSQIGMKYDMGGAAMTFAAACAMASLKVPLRITVITPLVENDISSTAFHTTDIITMRNGKSVQVDNTDAEGRLILADALCLASEMNPDWIVDAATLTGACVVALGEDIAGVFGTDREFNRIIITAGEDAGEYLWEMPLHMPYMEQLKATIADMKNIGTRWGGAITAALFLKKFVSEDITWTHIDIAGPCVKEEPLGFLGKGAKGFGVRTLMELARKLGG